VLAAAGEQRGFARERLWETHRAALDDALRAMGARGAALYDSGRNDLYWRSDGRSLMEGVPKFPLTGVTSFIFNN
jgi:hypothetical protein